MLNRRTLLAGLGVAGIGVIGVGGLAGCAGEAGASAGATGEASGTANGAEAGALPVTIEHKYGKTTVQKAPERIVCVGLKEQDDLLAVGLMPVGATSWLDFGDKGVLGTWAKPRATDAEITVLNQDDGIQFEKIAALRPDLILALYSGISRADYDKLSRLAPVVAAPQGLVEYGIAWEDQARSVGRAVGRPARMQQAIDETKAKISKAADEHPEFSGKSGVVATLYEGIYVYGPQDPRSRLITELGFALPDDLARAAGDKSFGDSISMEKIGLIDTDALIWLVSPSNADFKTLAKNKLYQNLRVAQQGRAITIESLSELDNAFNFSTALSIPYALDQLVPRLVAALDGDPSTTTD